MNLKIVATTFAIALSLTATSGQASELQMPARAAGLLGQYISQQGNAALIHVRNEIRSELSEALRPLLPDVRKQMKFQPSQDANVESTTTR